VRFVNFDAISAIRLWKKRKSGMLSTLSFSYRLKTQKTQTKSTISTFLIPIFPQFFSFLFLPILHSHHRSPILITHNYIQVIHSLPSHTSIHPIHKPFLKPHIISYPPKPDTTLHFLTRTNKFNYFPSSPKFTHPWTIII